MGKSATRLAQQYIRSKANQQQLCRFDHDKKSAEDLQHPPQLPSRSFMINALIQARREKREKRNGVDNERATA